MSYQFLQSPLNSGAIILEDGNFFKGYSFGYEGTGLHEGCVGEIVFNTAMSGYQEILTDPSYYGQIVVMTYPLIGNYGINPGDIESTKLFLSGLVVHEFSAEESNWRAQDTLREYLQKNKIPALCGIDTREITRHIRAKGAMNAYLLSPAPQSESELKKVVTRLKSLPAFGERDLVADVSCKTPYDWSESTDELHAQWRSEQIAKNKKSPLVVVLDLGCKMNSLRNFTARGCRVKVMPVATPADKILALKPQGLFLSNGPGDPQRVANAIDTTKKLLGKLHIFGICMGHQILAESIGAKTFKMKFGHHGGNQPVLDLNSGRVMITSQNHGYAVDANTLPAFAKVTQINLNDKSVEGISLPEHKAFSVQYHPEACPGPRDAEGYFDDFVKMLN